MDKILIVDDDQNILKLMKMRLDAEGYHSATATLAEEAVEIAKYEIFDLALVDLKLEGKNGIEVMEDLHRINPEMPIIILTAYGTIRTAVEAMSKGAFTYLTKPFDYRELLEQINNCLEKNSVSEELKRPRSMAEDSYGFENIIGKSEKIKKVLETVAQAADSDANVYIEGESGTGKELIASTLHQASSRRDGPFVVINCAAIPETLFESELFGYKKGAFTGASKDKKGLFAQANKGTFFLDEISEMPLAMQAKLLRVLQEKEFYPLGGGESIKVDARLVATSNKNLEEEVRKGDFREDLFYRIHVILITLPPLRERREDIALLAKYFLESCAGRTQKKIKGFSTYALQKLLSHSWPGNVRELENTVESAVAMATQNLITEDLILQTRNVEVKSPKPLKNAKEDFEKKYLIQLIELTQGNVSRAAKLAGKYRADFYELLRKYDIKPADFRKV